ncbi:MAG: hypothetical protein ISQ19_00965 [PS1 clade bacterium]|uniref:Dual OB-containing domain-containing protein n=1 Tax=PS1 clade bacterium TaxID=2175152 RepID=A0A937HEF7_9PROT|nr:hypothetical protein [PS1 clade bacterium]
MERKSIVCFANSRKLNRKCFAGKDIASRSWVRPVSSRSGQEIEDTEQKLSGGGVAKLLDVISVPFESVRPQNHSAYQSENCLIANEQWKFEKSLNRHEALTFADSMADPLWLRHSPGNSDRVPKNQITKINHSLCLLLVEKLEITVSQNKYGEGKKVRAEFRSGVTDLDLSVTDCEIERVFKAKESGTYPVTQNVLLCLSLGELYRSPRSNNEDAYKLVCGLITQNPIV